MKYTITPAGQERIITTFSESCYWVTREVAPNGKRIHYIGTHRITMLPDSTIVEETRDGIEDDLADGFVIVRYGCTANRTQVRTIDDPTPKTIHTEFQHTITLEKATP
jgi:hypothetical protein